jgi:26S proteasome regulatory subunit N2
LAALGTRNQGIYEQLRDVLYQNEAVSGEAAGIAMGLVMAGSMNNEVRIKTKVISLRDR